jgi:hypothetical protein
MKREPELPGCALLFLRLLASLPHGGSPPYGNLIFGSGEVCRHSKINSAQDISPGNVRCGVGIECGLIVI